ncbi:MAG TPA: hypothetical protein VKC63_00190 [Solirubrobacterales bacterium]|nr:hypothetical protein [Solirubrobacterales bacterium]
MRHVELAEFERDDQIPEVLNAHQRRRRIHGRPRGRQHARHRPRGSRPHGQLPGEVLRKGEALPAYRDFQPREGLVDRARRSSALSQNRQIGPGPSHFRLGGGDHGFGRSQMRQPGSRRHHRGALRGEPAALARRQQRLQIEFGLRELSLRGADRGCGREDELVQLLLRRVHCQLRRGAFDGGRFGREALLRQQRVRDFELRRRQFGRVWRTGERLQVLLRRRDREFRRPDRTRARPRAVQFGDRPGELRASRGDFGRGRRRRQVAQRGLCRDDCLLPGPPLCQRRRRPEKRVANPLLG